METCKFPVGTKACTNAARYTFVLEGGIQTFRCKNHMAGNILKMELLNEELMTIQKI